MTQPSTEDWTELEEAITAFGKAYFALMKARVEHREGSRKIRDAQTAYEAAHEVRAQAALVHWTEEDGMVGNHKRLGPVLQRYYAATMKPHKKGKR